MPADDGRRVRRGSTWVAIAALATAAPAAAQSPAPPMELTRLSGVVTIDGLPDEAAWGAIAPLPLTLYTPVFRGAPTQRTEIRVAYDDEALYAAGWFYDEEPARIRVNSLYRDRWNGDDAFALYLDVFDDNRNAKWFGVTPAGMRFDVLVSDDGATTNASWDAFWTARSTITAEGWFTEVRIPFSTLGFQVGDDGRALMGMTATRLVSRLEERVTFPAIDPKFEFRRPSVAQDVVLRDVRSRRALHVTPYALTGTARSVRPDDGPAGFHTERGTSREVGLDMRYPLSSELTLDVTLNTDFAQVEADDQQVNLDRFPLFYPERRRFFQEGSGLFDFATGGNARLFHSRRIGLSADASPVPVPVLGGARLVGRVGQWDVGLLEMQTERQAESPGENFGVLRLRRPVLNPWSTAGVRLTSYAGGGRRNVAAAADGTFRLHGDDWLTLKAATTVDDDDPTGADLATRSLIDARLERRVGRGLAYTLSAARAGRDFRPELGFLPRRDFTTANVLANWFRFADDSSRFRRVFPGMLAFSTWRNDDRALESGQYAVWLQWETKAGGGGWIEPKLFREDVRAPFGIGRSITIPAGDYTFADLQLALSMSNGRRLRTGMDLRSGTYFDGWRTRLALTPTWNVSRFLELGADYEVTRLSFADRGQREDVQVGRLRVRGALDARLSGNAFVQYSSAARRADVNLRLRWAVAEGTDLWLVYNEGLDTDRGRGELEVERPLSLARALILKYAHTVSF